MRYWWNSLWSFPKIFSGMFGKNCIMYLFRPVGFVKIHCSWEKCQLFLESGTIFYVALRRRCAALRRNDLTYCYNYIEWGDTSNKTRPGLLLGPTPRLELVPCNHCPFPSLLYQCNTHVIIISIDDHINTHELRWIKCLILRFFACLEVKFHFLAFQFDIQGKHWEHTMLIKMLKLIMLKISLPISI